MAQFAVPLAIAAITAGVTVGATELLAPKPAKMPAPVPVPTRTATVTAALQNDSEFRKRQGAAATMLTGPSGAEAPSPGAKALLGQ